MRARTAINRRGAPKPVIARHRITAAATSASESGLLTPTVIQQLTKSATGQLPSSRREEICPRMLTAMAGQSALLSRGSTSPAGDQPVERRSPLAVATAQAVWIAAPAADEMVSPATLVTPVVSGHPSGDVPHGD
jgi:hypothetical protein